MKQRATVSSALVAALVVIASACGPSQTALFEEAIAKGYEALAADDLVAAEVQFMAAGELQPNAPEFAAALDDLHSVESSRSAFLKAVDAEESGNFREALDAYLAVSEIDKARFSDASTRIEVVEGELRRVEAFGAILDEVVSSRDAEEMASVIRSARSRFRAMTEVEAEIQQRVESIFLIAATTAQGMAENQDFGEAELLLTDLIDLVPLSDTPASDEVRSTFRLIEQGREDLRQSRIAAFEEGGGHSGASSSRTGSASDFPSVAGPVMPPGLSRPADEGQRTVDGCPSPGFDVVGWRECLNERSIAETGCPSVIYDREAWSECVFGAGRDGGVTPPPAAPRAPSVPKAPESDASGEAAQREAARRDLQLREASAVDEYQRQWRLDYEANLEFQRRVRELDDQIEFLLETGQTSAAAIEQMRKEDYLRSQGQIQASRRQSIDAAERELNAIREQLRALSE